MSEPAPIDQRRLSFGSVAEQYDRHRPSYPPQLVQDAIAYAGAHPGDRALEVGPGTGKATLLFAARGLRVTAVEPDDEMAAVARRRLAEAGIEAEILSADFESAFDRAGVPEHAFKLVFSATAWHWVTPALRNRLAARALVSGGALAPFWNRPDWGVNPLRQQLGRIYSDFEAEFGATPAGAMNPLGQPAETKVTRDWLEAELADQRVAFTDVDVLTYRTPIAYTIDEYLALIGTHSDHHLLPSDRRDQLFERIASVIDAAGGSFELIYETQLCLARRV
jgi:SAM-dependent methyltransferase